MGEILAVMVRQRLAGLGRVALLSGIVLGTALAGCGSDTSKTEGTSIAIGVVKGLKQKLLPGKTAPVATPDPEKLAAAAKSSFSGPIILAQIEKSGLLTVLGEYGRNGATRTYSTPNQQTLVLRDGLLIATRGLGDDLMSSESAAAAALVTRRQSGNVARVYRYLDGEGIERPLPMKCAITLGPSKSLDFSGSHYDTVQVDETCKSGGVSMTNTYWVTAGGTVALSRQWIGPALGHVTIQLVRP
ncbi:YjbF family lipoprotein [Defluviimonas sp. SAOS-178_SWC]|uniref:YjbF family lipoprotein n=1 Tax=Defluviimonas sp. SAOS-178_SWC TaxID=3121287 RepID=UPI0032217CF8